jgi:DNA replication protein DnaC
MNTLIPLCKQLQLTSIAQYVDAACEQAARQQQSHRDFLMDLLQHEYNGRLERRSKRRIKEAHFSCPKTLDGFDFSRLPHVPQSLIQQLAHGNYIQKAEPILFIGEPGTGKTHLATALGMAAAAQGKSVRFVTASFLANQLLEARDARTLSRITQQYVRYQLLIIDELGYVPLSKTDAELVFQVLAARHEKSPVIITTNLPFSEWTHVFPDARLCKALIDRVTHRAHIIDTGERSIRFEQTTSTASIQG